jgi:hypothetical protein
VKVKNQLHWVRDVTFGEDLSQARTGTAQSGTLTVTSQRHSPDTPSRHAWTF